MEPITDEDYERLGSLVEDNHHGVLDEPDTCDVDAACAAGLYLLAAHMLVNTTDVSAELESELARLHNKERLSHEQREFELMPRYRCERCGVTVNCWDEDHTTCHGCKREPALVVVARAFHEAALRRDPSDAPPEKACACGAATQRLAAPQCARIQEWDDEEGECIS